MTPPEKPLHVFFVIGSLDVGGTESQLLLLTRELIGAGHKCTVFALDGSGKLSVRFRNCGATVIDGGYRSRRYLRFPSAVLRLVFSVRRLRPDVVHGFLPLANVLAGIAGKIAQVRRIITSRRSLGKYQDHNRIWYFTDRLANKLSDRVTVNAEAVRLDVQQRENLGPPKLVVIKNAVQPGRRSESLSDAPQTLTPISSECFIYLNVANLIPYKGQRYLIEAFARVCTRFPDSGLVIVGDDRGIGDELDGLAKKLGIGDRVYLAGYRDNVADWLDYADCAVLASLEEGFNNFVIEAMMVGKPVIATRVGGNVEALEDGRSGILVAERDREALASAMIKTRQGVGYDLEEVSRNACREYAATKMMQANLALYQ